MRYQAAILLNLFVPGTGLILLRREWLGAALAGLYGVLVQLGLWGCLVEPARMPAWLVTCGLAGGAVVWLAAQLLLRRRLPVLRDPGIDQELHRLRNQAAEYLANGDYVGAWGVLQVALAINDEDLETGVQIAELMTSWGRFQQARRAWHRVEQLDRRRVHRKRSVEALACLPRR